MHSLDMIPWCQGQPTRAINDLLDIIEAITFVFSYSQYESYRRTDRLSGKTNKKPRGICEDKEARVIRSACFMPFYGGMNLTLVSGCSTGIEIEVGHAKMYAPQSMLGTLGYLYMDRYSVYRCHQHILNRYYYRVLTAPNSSALD